MKPSPMRTRDAVRYGFACGKVRVLEERVFGRGMYERLLDAVSFGDQRRLLSDTPYGRFLEHVDTADGVERALAEALDGFYRFLEESSLPAPVVRFFRVRHDFEALRGSLKARALGVGSEERVAHLGTVRPEMLAGPAEDLPAPFAEAAAAALAPGGGAGALKAIDQVIDRALFAELRRCATESRSEFLQELAATLVDTVNVRALVRARRSGLSVQEAEAALIDGGALRVGQVGRLYGLPVEELAARLAALPALSDIPPEDIADTGRLDVAVENAVVRYLRRARVVPVGPEPVIAYVFAREAEVSAVRMVLIGKLSGLSPDLLRRRLRDLYL